ncbi:FtsB family cell division protein [Mycobacteroides franklinii]|uniref:Septum formation initiator family protein n=1 Tax=Mycobacteroides franklinii TaxID=948102 RepID=A0A4R5P6L9_9MYCO|nr:septum formation initiator family protein [Mycobacteroides franklinii]TDH19084.1 septum formation initiator family protein [Mycobacteroides franklinii]
MAESKRRPASGRSRGPAPAARKRTPVKRPAQKVVRGPAAPAKATKTTGAVAASIERSAEHQSEQRLGSTARRAAILAAVVCALTLTVAGPVRTYFSQQAERNQLAAAEAQLREQIASLEDKKRRLADPAYIAAQARERLGFVMPGEVPFQVQLPNTPVDAKPQGQGPVDNGNPWYTNLWHNIADSPAAIPTAPPTVPPAPTAPRP